MNRRKIMSVLLSLVLMLSLLPLPAASADSGGFQCSVVLLPGDGEGYGAEYLSMMQHEIPVGRENAGNCEFYYEEDGTMGFKTDEGWYPSDWTPPWPGMEVISWSDGEAVYHRLEGPSTSLTAVWGGEGYDYPYGVCFFASDSITLTSCGFSDFDLSIDLLEMKEAKALWIEFDVGNLHDDNGNSIPVEISTEVTGTTEHHLQKAYLRISPRNLDDPHIITFYVDTAQFDEYRYYRPGTYTATLTYMFSWDTSGQGHTVPGHTGEIQLIMEVSPPVTGDVNGDGRITNKDVTRLMHYLKDPTTEVNAPALDINGDGKVNNKDLTRLQRYLKYHDVMIY